MLAASYTVPATPAPGSDSDSDSDSDLILKWVLQTQSQRYSNWFFSWKLTSLSIGIFIDME